MKIATTQVFTREQRTLLSTNILSAYFYVAVEWVFFVTKPSPFSDQSFFETLKLLILTGGAVALFPLLGILGLLLIARSIHRAQVNEKIVRAAYICPALVLSVTALIVLDNFTYTVFSFGIISTNGAMRIVYMAGIMVFFLWMFRSLPKNKWIHNRLASLLSLGLMSLSIAGFLAIYFSNSTDLHNPYTDSTNGDYPNIIILGGDGLSADYLSAYGFSLNTTPFLSELRESSLIAENAFPNAASTTASTASILTGKESIEAQVFRYPDILSGRDSFEHLPGILQQHGYLTVEVGTPYYVDAGKLNLLDGFEMTYNLSLDIEAVNVLKPILGNSPSMYLLRSITARAAERLLHIFFIRDMDNAITAVHDPAARISDEKRVDMILDTIDNADRPVFIFTHMMDTHGPKFYSEQYKFSSGRSTEEWDISNYLDAIHTFDGNVKTIYDHLANTGKLDNTILVIYTDHGFNYAIDERIPIIIHFPQGEFSGVIHNNVQVIDIPVTLLDYVGIEQPEWMSGYSLTKGEPARDRILFATTSGDPEQIAPPFYQLNILQGIACDRWYQLDVRKKTFRFGSLTSHTAPCLRHPNHEEIYLNLLGYLDQHNYDTQTLR